MNHQWLITSFALAFGFALAMVAWVISRLAAQVPEQDRVWFDPPPLGFRLLWWPVQWLAYYLDDLIPARSKNKLQIQLRSAGVDFALNPAQFMAGRLWWGCAMGVAGVLLAQSFAMSALWPFCSGFALGFIYPAVWIKDRIDSRRRDTMKALPFMLDLITLCVESGLNLSGAFQQAVDKGPPGALKDEFSRLLGEVRTGRARSDALRELAQRMNLPAVTSFVATLIQAEATGMSLGPILRAQAEQRRVERFSRAEKLAMEAPVKLLFPLIFFIFPCVFAILMFPIAMKFLAAGT